MDYIYDILMLQLKELSDKGKELWKNVLVTLFTIIFFALFFMLIQYLIVLIKMIDFKSIVETVKGWF